MPKLKTTKNNENYLLICPFYPPPFIGGSKVWIFNLIENARFDFDILTSAITGNYKEVSNARHRMLRKSLIWNPVGEESPTTWDLMKSYGYILAWFCFFGMKYQKTGVIAGAFTFANGLLFLLGRLFNIPVIGICFAEEFTLALKGKGIKNLIKRIWIRFAHKKAAGFIVVCDFCKDILVSIGVDPRRIEVVPPNINPQKLRTRACKKEKGHTVLSVGRIVERKGFHLLIHAVSLLKDTIPDIRLIIVGDGPYIPILKDLIYKNKLDNHVFLKSRVSDGELASLYNESDLFVLAHVMLKNGDTEGCPVVFAEASGCGLPVIGGVEGGASNVITEGITGFLVNPKNVEELAEKIKTLLSDRELAGRMGKNGIEKIAKDHTPEATGKKFSNAIEMIISQSI
jgi:glycosyltransferase involved in cell wall biosynthesis